MEFASTILLHLIKLYGEHNKVARYEISKQLFRMKLPKVEDVGPYMHKIIKLIDHLDGLDFIMDATLQLDLILQLLLESFRNFNMNFNMNKMECVLV